MTKHSEVDVAVPWSAPEAAPDEFRRSAVQPDYVLLGRLAGQPLSEPLAGGLLPPPWRVRLGILYAVEDLLVAATSGPLPPGVPTTAMTRLRLLEAIHREITSFPGRRRPRHPVLRRARRLLRRHSLPSTPLHRRVAAASQAIEGGRHARFDDLYRYCEQSAAVLADLTVPLLSRTADGPATEVRLVYVGAKLIDVCCTVRPDAAMNRMLLPREDLASLGASDRDVLGGDVTGSCRAVIEALARRGEAMIRLGRQAATSLPIPARIAVTAAALEALSAFNGLERIGFDSASRPAPVRSPRRRDLIRAVLRPAD